MTDLTTHAWLRQVGTAYFRVWLITPSDREYFGENHSSLLTAQRN